MAEIQMDVTGVCLMVLNITNLELAKFIGTKKGEHVSRLQVIKKVVAHLKEKNLQDPENEESFIPDETFDQEAIGSPKCLAYVMSWAYTSQKAKLKHKKGKLHGLKRRDRQGLFVSLRGAFK